ncbi:hypothetical protein KC325_g235 [Hortaea werneckii]|nr:hypothetical protein KC325_g235 [Hortaea werneckii]
MDFVLEHGGKKSSANLESAACCNNSPKASLQPTLNRSFVDTFARARSVVTSSPISLDPPLSQHPATSNGTG